MRYVYLGDRLTDPRLVGAACDPVRRPDGRCVVSAGAALVQLADGRRVGVVRRRLRLADKVDAAEVARLRAAAWARVGGMSPQARAAWMGEE